MLTDLILWQQRKYVRTSTGELAHECFTDVDFESFKAAGTPQKIVERLKTAKDFEVIAEALRTLPGVRFNEVINGAKQLARPPWRQMGFIDREGRGQTEAGHKAELMIAAAIAVILRFAPRNAQRRELLAYAINLCGPMTPDLLPVS